MIQIIKINFAIMKALVYTVLFLQLVSCGDLHLGMRYQKSVVQGNLSDSLYCYRFAWGRDAESLVISMSKDVCQGFDSTKDICFGRGHVEIYYKVTADTLDIFSNINPIYPKDFKYHVVIKELNNDDYSRLEVEHKQGKIEKISFDKVVSEVPCRAIPIKSPYSIKFR